ncbi:hypothetical protein HYH02_011382 [Chlamydomonas schloesseri]|uniref:MIF4G domain-containing protein n=1 Tax=Chlamydomonas schloesseri TaxID=2026947 RepID=A0A835W666_9CHLO|nr:hypothetical protein HYH02_011382 [Chlamydomonas schloesseri]|eukprot:KAG2437126.1 hypothetical protein HYH02_011382 [Chlamydomonas schloesseri]
MAPCAPSSSGEAVQPKARKDAQDSSETAQSNAVATCLERLKPGHFQAKRLAFEIRDVGFTPAGSLSTLQLLVRWIYDRAVSDPERFAGPCSALCFSLTPILPTFKPPGATTAAQKAKRIDFRQTLLNLCQREFEAACGLVSQAGSGDAPALKAGTTTTLSGSLQFLAYLYLHALLTDRIMLSCLLLVSNGAAGPAVPTEAAGERLTGEAGRQRVECLTKALTIAGRQLDDCLAAQHRPLLDALYQQLSTLHTSCSGGCSSSSSSSSGLPPDMVASLGKLLELRAGGWHGVGGALVASAPASAPSGAAPSDGGTPQPRSARASANGTPAASTNGVGGAAAARGAAGAAGPGPGSRASSGGGPPTGLPPIPRGSGGGGAVSPAQRPPVLRRVAGMSGNSNGPGTPSGAMSSRGSSTNLDGMWNLAPDTYSDVRAQLLSQPVANSPATLEAMADELIECAVAAAGGDAHCPCWGAASAAVASTAGAVAGGPDGATPGPAAVMSNEDWATAMQQQWDEQSRACDIYVRLAVDALQNLGAEAASQPGSAAAAAAAAGGPNGAAAGSVSEIGRTFRRLLLQAAQTHFERCLAALLPALASTAPTPSASSSGTGPASSSGEAVSGLVSPLPVRVGASGPGTPAAGGSAALSPSPSPPPESAGSASTPASAGGGVVPGSRRAWADMPAAVPDAASALPRARGMCHLLLGLLRRGVLTPRIVLHCAAALVDGAAGGATGCMQCACILLAGAGKEAGDFKVAEAAAFESLVKRLQALPEQQQGAEAGSEGGDGAATAVVAEQRRRFMDWLARSLKAD